jgi:hypothetical protein
LKEKQDILQNLKNQKNSIKDKVETESNWLGLVKYSYVVSKADEREAKQDEIDSVKEEINDLKSEMKENNQEIKSLNE